MTVVPIRTDPSERVLASVEKYIASLSDELWKLNQTIHHNPELAYKEHHAHDAICDFLESLGFIVTRHAYGIPSALESISGCSGKLINFNAEMDALPDIGHACGHNLIATASVVGFLAASHVLRQFKIPGRVQLLGTPAEEAGGGKIDLMRKGAYKEVIASLMMHPVADVMFRKAGYAGLAGATSSAAQSMRCTYHGVTAHAGIAPWEGINALDALVSGYNNISMLRQQIRTDERVHGAIQSAPTAPNVIPDQTSILYLVRSRNLADLSKLYERVRHCVEAGALATGCGLEIKNEQAYADLRINEPLCEVYAQHMRRLGHKVGVSIKDLAAGSTDQGNVSYEMPALHALAGIPVADGSQNHTPGFTAAAGSRESHAMALSSGKALGMTAWSLFTDEGLLDRVEDDFQKDKERQAAS